MPSEDGRPDDDELSEECGVVGVYAPGVGQTVAHLTYLGLFALQHRGQEAAGMAVSDGTEIVVQKDSGLVASVFDDHSLAALDKSGHLAIGHTRYSTTGSSTWRNAQPVHRVAGEHQFALAHNGNLVNTAELADEAGMLPGTVASDSDLVAELLAAELEADVDQSTDGRALERAMLRLLPRLRGAFSFVGLDEGHLIGVRDPNGIRPLCLGRFDDGWVLASETPALDIMGATFVHELEPGEMVVIDATGKRSVTVDWQTPVDPRLCLFEFIYFARPDSQLYGHNMHQARVRMGEQLAEQAPADADLVMGVPESGIPAAEGFAHQSGIPYGQGVVKNRYIGRSFIAPDQEARARAVRMKLNPLRENIAGKRLVVIDDTIVRGTTQKQLVKMLKEAGASEIHLRITAPPVQWSCFYGIDTGIRKDLLAANLEIEEIRRYLGADSLAYLSLERVVQATGAPRAGFCDACFTGDYPVEVPVNLSKDVLEMPAESDAPQLLIPGPV